MRPDERLVRRTPLFELWDAAGAVPGARGRLLGAEEIRALLRAGPVRFAVADVGRPIRWISGVDVFEFWKREALPHLVSPAGAASGFALEAYPGEYAYVASAWEPHSEPPIVLLERHH